ncbi:MAG: hypothetical protein EB119_10485, partial [Synechococcaceae bacterium WBB_34_004]|nr:hypothetical protein [Synechococcaceae bacterium WBB_34_004]
GKKSNENPHAQFIFVDAEKIHREVTGPRVFGTTKRGSTAKLKLVWEEVHNQVMLEAGQEATISFADARKKAMERLAEQHGIPLEPFSRPHENGLDDVEPNAPLSNVDVPREAERTLTIELPDSRHSEEDMELVAPSGAIYARTAVDALKEKRRIEQAIARRDAAKASAEAAKSASEKAVTRANDMEKNELIPLTMRQAMAEQRMKTYTTDSGLKGFEINIWGLSYKSPTRKQAEQAQHELNSAVFARDMKQRDVTEAYQMAKSVVDGAKQAATEYEIAANRFKEIVAIYGTEQEMQGAMQLFDRQAFINAREITVAQIEEAYKEASINGEEYRDLLVLKGETEKVKEWEDMQKDLGWQK